MNYIYGGFKDTLSHMAGKKVLLVDDDQSVLQMVHTVVQQLGHQVHTANDGLSALAKLSQLRPDLIITDVMMDGMDGWTLVRTLRSNIDTAFIPVIFLTGLNETDNRIRGYRLGADDYLAKPFRIDELAVRVENVLRSADRIRHQLQREFKTASSENSGLKGDLRQLGLSAVLTLLENERKSGVLVVTAKGQEVGAGTGRIFLRNGQVVAANILLAGTQRIQNSGATESVYRMLSWQDGTFAFNTVDVDMEDQVCCSTTHLLIEGARLLDEATR